MKRTSFLLILLIAVLFSMQGYGFPLTVIQQGDLWNYSIFSSPDLWTNWSTIGYHSFDWANANWFSGNAAFGNPHQLPYNTYWPANTDLALQRNITLLGTLSSVTLNVASDNGFIVFVNGVQIAKENAEGYTSYWEYSFSNINPSAFINGENTISVLAEDHGGATFFDMQMTGDFTPIPEPSSILLISGGILSFGLMGWYRRKKS